MSAFINESCSTFYGDPFYIFMLQTYNTNTDKDNPECFVFNDFSTSNIASYVKQRNCVLFKEIVKEDIKLIHVYKCPV